MLLCTFFFRSISHRKNEKTIRINKMWMRLNDNTALPKFRRLNTYNLSSCVNKHMESYIHYQTQKWLTQTFVLFIFCFVFCFCKRLLNENTLMSNVRCSSALFVCFSWFAFCFLLFIAYRSGQRSVTTDDSNQTCDISFCYHHSIVLRVVKWTEVQAEQNFCADIRAGDLMFVIAATSSTTQY